MKGMCPHCGEIVYLSNGLTAFHNYPKWSRAICPGSKQNGRNAKSDARWLWNGQPNKRSEAYKTYNEDKMSKHKMIEVRYDDIKMMVEEINLEDYTDHYSDEEAYAWLLRLRKAVDR